jgi:hypothetical protein
MIDYRQLLKDCIRGQVWDFDIPALPSADPNRDVTDEELRVYFAMIDEVLLEQGESRPSVFLEVERLKQEYGVA